jgi:ATP synthase protein I
MSFQLRYTFAPLPGAKNLKAVLRHLSKPVFTVMRWQASAAVILLLAGAVFSGVHGAISAAAGGAVSIIAGLASALVASRSNTKSAGGVLSGALRGEAVKVGLAVLLLWLVLSNYDDVVAIAFIGSFLVTMLIFAMAFFVRDY